MKTGDWLKLSIFALIGVVISIVILGLNSTNNKRKEIQNSYGNYSMEMQGYSNAMNYPQQNQQLLKMGNSPTEMQMQGKFKLNNTNGEFNQVGYLPSQLLAMNYQMINNDVYLQKEITEIQQHGAKLHNEVKELQSQYGQLSQGLNSIYTTLNGQFSGNPTQRSALSYDAGMGNNGMQMMNTATGYTNPMQNQNGMSMGMGNMGYTTPMQNQNAMNNMNYNNPMQYPNTMGNIGNTYPMQYQNGMGAMGTGFNSPLQNQNGMSMGNSGSMQGSGSMGMNNNMMMDNMMMNGMMGMMNNMMGMMNNMGGMQGSGSTGSSGGMSSGGSGGGMGMM